jgi:hypothetical protein
VQELQLSVDEIRRKQAMGVHPQRGLTCSGGFFQTQNILLKDTKKILDINNLF